MKKYKLLKFDQISNEELSHITGGGDIFGPLVRAASYIVGFSLNSAGKFSPYAPITWPAVKRAGIRPY
ncbi:MAG: bacteriocin [Streptococcaceae bacterium]|jgi:bacteriocin-like protein|nr:bacteriocin [Streptococcaceae bacterium]